MRIHINRELFDPTVYRSTLSMKYRVEVMDSQESDESSSLMSVQNLLNGNTDALRSFESVPPLDPVIREKTGYNTTTVPTQRKKSFDKRPPLLESKKETSSSFLFKLVYFLYPLFVIIFR